MNFNGYGQYYNPGYMSNNIQMQQQPQFNTFQQSQPTIRQPLNLYGRTVSTFDEVTANDVPMDGSVAYFPKSDLSEIEVRQWNSNGTISKIVFKPIQEQKVDNVSSDNEKSVESAFNEFTELFNERLDKLEKMIAPKRTTKKESDTE